MEKRRINTADGRKMLTYHLVALFTVAVWGATFVSTKVLISHGLTPTWIFIVRFAIAYLATLAVSHRRLWTRSVKDELCIMATGLTGGSLYFIAENTALRLTFASNVSLIICTTPVLTMMLGALICKKRISLRAIAGSLIALCGVTAVILNGSLKFGLNPAGDLLTLLAALLWATYCMLLQRMTRLYPNTFITRKVFFYGCTSALLFAAFEPRPVLPEADALGAVALNFLFLGLLASFVCYVLWNAAVKRLGPERAANYIYFSPLITIVASSLILGEPVSLWMLLGGLAIIGGVYLTAR